MIVAGIGCRRGCPADAIVALLREAGPADALAAPWFKRQEAGLLEAAAVLGLAVRFVEAAELGVDPSTGPQALRSAHPSVAEACAVAGGGTLLRARIKNAVATCALALHPHPFPLAQAGEGEASVGA